MKPKTVFLTTFIVTTCVYLGYAHFQEVYTYALTDSRLDAHQYIKQYNYFKGITPNYEVRFPFNTRILSAWLASWFPLSTVENNFRAMNGIVIILTFSILAYFWKQLQIRTSLIFCGLFFLLFHWKGPLRMYLPDPANGDVLGYLISSLWLVLLNIKYKDVIFSFSKISNFREVSINIIFLLLAILGIMQKESFLLIVLITLFFKFRPINQLKRLSLAILFTATLTLIPLILTPLTLFHFFPASNPDWRNNPVISLARGVQRYALNPALFLRLPISWLFTFGGFLILNLEFINLKKLYITYPTSYITHPTSYIIQRFTLYITITWFLLSIFAGGDTSRILMTAFPFVFTFLLLKLNDKPIWVEYFALIISIPFMRLFELEPDLGKFPQFSHRWCVECWLISESWGYLVYALAVSIIYFYLIRSKTFKF